MQVWLPTAITMVLLAFALIFLPIIMQPQIEFLYAFLVVIVGLVFYYPFIYKKWELPFMS